MNANNCHQTTINHPSVSVSLTATTNGEVASTMPFSGQKVAPGFPQWFSQQTEPSAGQAAHCVLASRDIKSVNARKALMINLSNNKNSIAVPKFFSQQEYTSYYTPFSIDGYEFESIDGNNRDQQLAPIIEKQDWQNIGFVFNRGEQYCVHISDEEWAKNFCRCITEGLSSFISLNMNEDTVHSLTGKTHKETFKEASNIPTCNELTAYFHFGYVDFPAAGKYRIKCEIVNDINAIEPFTILGIEINKHMAHQFTYIAHGVCIGKLGVTVILFQHIDDVIEHFRKAYGVSSHRLLKLNYVVQNQK